MFKKAGTAGVAQKKYKVNESTGLQGNVNYGSNENYIPQININRIRESLSRENLADISTLNFMQDQLMEEIADLEILLKQVLDLAEDGILILNSNLCPIYWNAKVEEMGLSMGRGPVRSSQIDRSLPGLPPDLIEEYTKIKISRQPTNDALNSDSQNTVFNIDGNPRLKVQINRLITRQRSSKNSNSSYLLLTFHESDQGCREMEPIASDEKFLTLRESEVLHFIRQGLTNKEIGKKLCVSLPTVATHVRHIFKKMGICSRTKLICQLDSKSNRLSRLEI